MIGLLAAATASGQAYDELLGAATRGDVKIVGDFLSKGLDPNTADPTGNTLLMIASREGHFELVKMLVSRKASVVARSPHGDTALMFASLKGRMPIVEFLVEHGAQLSQPGWTPVHYAAFEGRSEVLKFLIGRGANKDAVAPNGYSALMLAIRGDHVDAARTLLYEDVDLSVTGPKGETALSLATAKKNEDLIRLLKRSGAAK